MKKIFNLLTCFLFLASVGLVFAESMNDGVGSSSQGSGEIDKKMITLNGTVDAYMMENHVQAQENVRSGNFETSDGKQVMIQERTANRLELQSGEAVVRTGLQIDSKNGSSGLVLSAKLSNGKNAEIKVMPDVASETALERLRLKNCVEESGCQIELKEVGEGESSRLAYEVRAERTSRVFGLFKKQMQVEAQVDAENGEVIRANKPWWAFLASEPEE